MTRTLRVILCLVLTATMIFSSVPVFATGATEPTDPNAESVVTIVPDEPEDSDTEQTPPDVTIVTPEEPEMVIQAVLPPITVNSAAELKAALDISKRPTKQEDTLQVTVASSFTLTESVMVYPGVTLVIQAQRILTIGNNGALTVNAETDTWFGRINNSGTIAINAGSVLENNGNLINYGIINGNGTFKQNATLTNSNTISAITEVSTLKALKEVIKSTPAQKITWAGTTFEPITEAITLPSSCTLTVAAGKTLTVNSPVTVNGTIVVIGTIDGTSYLALEGSGKVDEQNSTGAITAQVNVRTSDNLTNALTNSSIFKKINIAASINTQNANYTIALGVTLTVASSFTFTCNSIANKGGFVVANSATVRIGTGYTKTDAAATLVNNGLIEGNGEFFYTAGDSVTGSTGKIRLNVNVISTDITPPLKFAELTQRGFQKIRVNTSLTIASAVTIAPDTDIATVAGAGLDTVLTFGAGVTSAPSAFSTLNNGNFKGKVVISGNWTHKTADTELNFFDAITTNGIFNAASITVTGTGSNFTYNIADGGVWQNNYDPKPGYTLEIGDGLGTVGVGGVAATVTMNSGVESKFVTGTGLSVIKGGKFIINGAISSGIKAKQDSGSAGVTGGLVQCPNLAGFKSALGLEFHNFTLTGSMTIAAGNFMIIPTGVTVTIAKNKILTVDGQLVNYGAISLETSTGGDYPAKIDGSGLMSGTGIVQKSGTGTQGTVDVLTEVSSISDYSDRAQNSFTNIKLIESGTPTGTVTIQSGTKLTLAAGVKLTINTGVTINVSGNLMGPGILFKPTGSTGQINKLASGIIEAGLLVSDLAAAKALFDNNGTNALTAAAITGSLTLTDHYTIPAGKTLTLVKETHGVLEVPAGPPAYILTVNGKLVIAPEAELRNFSSIEVNSGGSIVAESVSESSSKVGIINNLSTGVITNNGTISGGGTLRNGGTLGSGSGTYTLNVGVSTIDALISSLDQPGISAVIVESKMATHTTETPKTPDPSMIDIATSGKTITIGTAGGLKIAANTTLKSTPGQIKTYVGGGKLSIEGSWVYDGTPFIGNGGALKVAPGGTLNVHFATEIDATWKQILTEFTLVGSAESLQATYTWPETYKLTIDRASIFSIPKGRTFINNGHIINNGTVVKESTSFFKHNPLNGGGVNSTYSGTGTIVTRTLVDTVTIRTDPLGIETVPVGRTVQFRSTVLPINADIKAVTWSVSCDATVATISQSGLLSVKASDRLTEVNILVSAKANDGSASDSVSLTVTPKASIIRMFKDTPTTSEVANNVAPTPLRSTINFDNEIPIKLRITLDGRESTFVAWSSSNAKVVKVDATGLVSVVGGGACSISARATDGSDISAIVDITVNTTLTGLRVKTPTMTKKSPLPYPLNPDDPSNLVPQQLSAGKSIAATVEYIPASTTQKGVGWYLSNTGTFNYSDAPSTDLVTVDPKLGIVTAKYVAQKTTVYLFAVSSVSSSIMAYREIELLPVDGITFFDPVDVPITHKYLPYVKNNTYQIYSQVIYKGLPDVVNSYTSSNKNIATVGETTGLVTLLSTGVVKITAKLMIPSLDSKGDPIKDSAGKVVMKSVASAVLTLDVVIPSYSTTITTGYDTGTTNTITRNRGTKDFRATVNGATANTIPTNRLVYWSVRNDTGWATIDRNTGRLTAYKNGIVWVTAEPRDGIGTKSADREVVISNQANNGSYYGPTLNTTTFSINKQTNKGAKLSARSKDTTDSVSNISISDSNGNFVIEPDLDYMGEYIVKLADDGYGKPKQPNRGTYNAVVTVTTAYGYEYLYDVKVTVTDTKPVFRVSMTRMNVFDPDSISVITITSTSGAVTILPELIDGNPWGFKDNFELDVDPLIKNRGEISQSATAKAGEWIKTTTMGTIRVTRGKVKCTVDGYFGEYEVAVTVGQTSTAPRLRLIPASIAISKLPPKKEAEKFEWTALELYDVSVAGKPKLVDFSDNTGSSDPKVYAKAVGTIGNVGLISGKPYIMFQPNPSDRNLADLKTFSQTIQVKASNWTTFANIRISFRIDEVKPTLKFDKGSLTLNGATVGEMARTVVYPSHNNLEIPVGGPTIIARQISNVRLEWINSTYGYGKGELIAYLAGPQAAGTYTFDLSYPTGLNVPNDKVTAAYSVRVSGTPVRVTYHTNQRFDPMNAKPLIITPKVEHTTMKIDRVEFARDNYGRYYSDTSCALFDEPVYNKTTGQITIMPKAGVDFVKNARYYFKFDIYFDGTSFKYQSPVNFSATPNQAATRISQSATSVTLLRGLDSVANAEHIRLSTLAGEIDRVVMVGNRNYPTGLVAMYDKNTGTIILTLDDPLKLAHAGRHNIAFHVYFKDQMLEVGGKASKPFVIHVNTTIK